MSFSLFKSDSLIKPLQCDHKKLFSICMDLMTIQGTDHKIVVLKEINGYFYPALDEKKGFGKNKTDKTVALKVCEFFDANKEQSADYVKALRILKKNISKNDDVKKAFRELIDNVLLFSGRDQVYNEIQTLKIEGMDELLSQSEKLKEEIEGLRGEKKKIQEELKLLQDQITSETRSLLNEHEVKKLAKDKRIKRLSLQIIQKRKSLTQDLE